MQCCLLNTPLVDVCIQVWFNEMEISVDRRQLIAEDDVPVGLLRCLYDTLVRCSCRPMRRPPLKTCCSQSILGSWSSKLLWLPLRRRTDEGTSRCCTWQSVLRSAGWLLLAAAVPLPYYIRLSVFYAFEDDEMSDRRAAVDLLGLRYGFDHDLFQWLTPTHGVVLAVYVCYAVSIVLVALLRRTCRPGHVDRLIADTVADLRRVRHTVSVRLLLAHFLLPLEKFGVVCGVLVGLVYWPVTLPLCLAAVTCYILPLVYVTGRLLIHSRCTCLSTLPLTTDGAQSANLSDGVTSFETCCFLDAISSSDDRCLDPVTAVKTNKVSSGCIRIGGTVKSVVIGLVLVVLVWSVLLLYAEAVGFAVEVVVMTSVGFVLNSGSDAARRVVVVAWCVVYAAACYRAAVGRYTQFSRAVFAAMKRRLGDQLLAAATQRKDCRRNVAFKYFTADEIQRLTTGEMSTTTQGDDMEAVATTPNERRTSLVARQLSDDSIEYQSNLLHWKITTLSLFVDRRDTAHIPRDLFTRLCRLDVPGSPRSGVRVVLTALGRLVIAGLFLLVLALVVELSADAETSDGDDATGQTLVTLACGALPLIVHAVFTRFSASRRFGSELFAGKVERAVLNYTQSWPVFDLLFQRRDQQTRNSESVTSRPEVDRADCYDQSRSLLSDATELKSASPRPTSDNHLEPVGSRDLSRSHVDLLITIRDEDDGGTARVKQKSGRSVATDRGSPVGSGNLCFDRQSPADESTAASATSASGVHQSSSRTARPQSVTIDEGNSESRKSHSRKEDRGGFLLRKQNSASTIQARNQMKPEMVSGNRTSSSTLVVDMFGDGDVMAMSAVAAAASTRSLPQHNDDDDDVDDVPDRHCESAL